MRPTLLVVEPEPEQALSARKLVLETGKFNILTAHSTREALDMFELFPNISAVVVVSCDAIDCETIIHTIKSARQNIVAVHLSPLIHSTLESADYNLSSHEPEQLLLTMRSLFGDPRQIKT